MSTLRFRRFSLKNHFRIPRNQVQSTHLISQQTSTRMSAQRYKAPFSGKKIEQVNYTKVKWRLRSSVLPYPRLRSSAFGRTQFKLLPSSRFLIGSNARGFPHGISQVSMRARISRIGSLQHLIRFSLWLHSSFCSPG